MVSKLGWCGVFGDLLGQGPGVALSLKQTYPNSEAPEKHNVVGLCTNGSSLHSGALCCLLKLVLADAGEMVSADSFIPGEGHSVHHCSGKPHRIA